MKIFFGWSQAKLWWLARNSLQKIMFSAWVLACELWLTKIICKYISGLYFLFQGLRFSTQYNLGRVVMVEIIIRNKCSAQDYGLTLDIILNNVFMKIFFAWSWLSSAEIVIRNKCSALNYGLWTLADENNYEIYFRITLLFSKTITFNSNYLGPSCDYYGLDLLYFNVLRRVVSPNLCLVFPIFIPVYRSFTEFCLVFGCFA